MPQHHLALHLHLDLFKRGPRVDATSLFVSQNSSCLVVEPTPLKNMIVKLDPFPRDPGGNKKDLKPPTSLKCLKILDEFKIL